jgi:hypothetical protein
MDQSISHDVEKSSEFEIDWSGHLDEGETIKKSVWSLDHDANKKLHLEVDHTEDASSVIVTGGIANCQHRLTNKITTSKRKSHTAEYWLNTYRVAKKPKAEPKPTPDIAPKG